MGKLRQEGLYVIRQHSQATGELNKTLKNIHCQYITRHRDMTRQVTDLFSARKQKNEIHLKRQNGIIHTW